MPDVVSREVRSRMMSGIRGKDTKPEMLVRRGLHRLGFRYRLHDSRLSGTPDLVLARHSAAVFVHGCFWHAHYGCRYFKVPQTRREFWASKLEDNAARDRRQIADLLNAGWRVGVIWECSLRDDPEVAVAALAAWILGDAKQADVTGLQQRAPQ